MEQKQLTNPKPPRSTCLICLDDNFGLLWSPFILLPSTFLPQKDWSGWIKLDQVGTLKKIESRFHTANLSCCGELLDKNWNWVWVVTTRCHRRVENRSLVHSSCCNWPPQLLQGEIGLCTMHSPPNILVVKKQNTKTNTNTNAYTNTNTIDLPSQGKLVSAHCRAQRTQRTHTVATDQPQTESTTPRSMCYFIQESVGYTNTHKWSLILFCPQLCIAPICICSLLCLYLPLYF